LCYVPQHDSDLEEITMITYEQKIYALNTFCAIKGIYNTRTDIFEGDLPDTVVDVQITRHIQYARAIKDGFSYIFFLGSNEGKDWLHNFQFRFRTVPYEETGTNKRIKVHSGFFNSYRLVRDNILLYSVGYSKVIYVGHSFGGALATFAALDVKYNYPHKTVACITAGAPRCGNEAFAKSFINRVSDVTRYVYGRDIVPGVPFKCMGYTDMPGRIEIGPRRVFPLSIKHHNVQRYADYYNELVKK